MGPDTPVFGGIGDFFSWLGGNAQQANTTINRAADFVAGDGVGFNGAFPGGGLAKSVGQNVADQTYQGAQVIGQALPAVGQNLELDLLLLGGVALAVLWLSR